MKIPSLLSAMFFRPWRCLDMPAHSPQPSSRPRRMYNRRRPIARHRRLSPSPWRC